MQSNPQVPWTEEQWARVNQAIQEEAQRARVAATFLPLYGPLPPDTDFVRSGDIPYAAPLTNQRHGRNSAINAADQGRAAWRAACGPRDGQRSVACSAVPPTSLPGSKTRLIFNGRHAPASHYRINSPNIGEQISRRKTRLGSWIALGLFGPNRYPTATTLVHAVARAIGHLEQDGHFGPFSVVLSQRLFEIAQEPSEPTTSSHPAGSR